MLPAPDSALIFLQVGWPFRTAVAWDADPHPASCRAPLSPLRRPLCADQHEGDAGKHQQDDQAGEMTHRARLV